MFSNTSFCQMLNGMGWNKNDKWLENFKKKKLKSLKAVVHSFCTD